MRSDGVSPLEFCRLEAVEGGTLVRFNDVRWVEMLGFCLPRRPLTESWRCEDNDEVPSPEKRKVPVIVPVGVFCGTPDRLQETIERARKAFEELAKEDGAAAGVADLGA